MSNEAYTEGPKGMGVYVMARIGRLAPPHELYEAADIASVAWHTVNILAPTVIAAEGDLVVADCVLDTEQTTSDVPEWFFDEGFNFNAEIPGEAFPTGGITYRLIITITPTGEDPILIEKTHKTTKFYPTS